MDKKPWTVMVYMIADEDKDDADDFIAALRDVYEIAVETTGVVNEEANVVVQVCPPSQFPAMRWEIKDSRAIPLSGAIDAKSFQQESLVNFVETCKDKFAAERYLLILWAHGRGVDWVDDSSLSGAVGAFGPMTLKGLADALKELNVSPENLVVGFSSCSMAAIEVYYEIQNATKLVIGGADDIPKTGWPYDKILNQFVEHQNIHPVNLAEAIVKEIAASYDRKGEVNRVSYSACNLEKFGDLIASLKILIEQLKPNLNDDKTLRAIKEARRFAEDYKEEAMVDLLAFCTRLSELVKEPAKGAAKGVVTVLKNEQAPFLIVSSYSSAYAPRYMRDSGALAVCFPETSAMASSYKKGWRIDRANYEALAFNKAMGWLEFVESFHTNAEAKGI